AGAAGLGGAGGRAARPAAWQRRALHVRPAAGVRRTRGGRAPQGPHGDLVGLLDRLVPQPIDGRARRMVLEDLLKLGGESSAHAPHRTPRASGACTVASPAMLRGMRATGAWLLLASVGFWLSWWLMPGVGVTDTATIFALVSQQRASVY